MCESVIITPCVSGLDFWDRVNQQRWEPETLWVLKYYLSKVRAWLKTHRKW